MLGVVRAFAPGFYVVALGVCAFTYLLEILRYCWSTTDEYLEVDGVRQERPGPTVTIQLPVCDERYVVERLIDACCRIDYPPARLDIQVLDDSTDITTALIARKVGEQRDRGVNISHVRRETREGFKAGNLRHARGEARGEFLALFDADCVPDPEFLRATLPYFDDGAVGIVQAAVRHSNRDQSLLTRAQAPLADGPAIARVRGRRVIGRFHGSAAVIRRSCLDDVGGWQTDTLAEDHDLSIRAHLRGWRCVLVDLPLASAELPQRMHDFKNRVERCSTGPSQCYRKHLGALLRTRPGAFGSRLRLLPVLFCAWLSVSSVALVAVASVLVVAWPAAVSPWLLSVPSIVVAMLAIGLALHRRGGALAATALVYGGTAFRAGTGALTGLLGLRRPFNRTPKWGSAATRSSEARAYPIAVTPATFMEGVLAVLFAGAIALALRTGTYWLVPFHLYCCASCAVVFVMSVAELW